MLVPLATAGYHLVAPSMPGFGFSSYTNKAGFKNWHHAEIMHQLMTGLGYDRYVVAESDWVAMITGSIHSFEAHVQAIYLTNVSNAPFMEALQWHTQLGFTLCRSRVDPFTRCLSTHPRTRTGSRTTLSS